MTSRPDLRELHQLFNHLQDGLNVLHDKTVTVIKANGARKRAFHPRDISCVKQMTRRAVRTVERHWIRESMLQYVRQSQIQDLLKTDRVPTDTQFRTLLTMERQCLNALEASERFEKGLTLEAWSTL